MTDHEQPRAARSREVETHVGADVVAVTGATGTLGREIVAALLATDPAPRVRAVVRDPARAAAVLPAQVEVRHGDFANPGDLPAAFAGARAVLLLCGHHSDQLTLERTALTAAVRAGVPRVVYVSAAGAGGDPVPALAADHRRVENELAAVPGLHWAVLRPTAAFPSLLGGLRRLVTPDGVVPLAFGTARINLIDARDIGAAAAALLRDRDAGNGGAGATHGRRVFTLTGPHSFTRAELVDTLAVATGRLLAQLREGRSQSTQVVGEFYGVLAPFVTSNEMPTCPR